MKIPELLQIELWSKRTSRRLFVGIGIVFVVAFVGVGALSAIGKHWLTPGERKAAKIALQQIEELPKGNSASYDELFAMHKTERKAIAIAEAEAVTEKDHTTVMQLEACVSEVNSDRLIVMLRQTRAGEATPEQMESRVEFLSRASKSRDLAHGICKAIHQTLD